MAVLPDGRLLVAAEAVGSPAHYFHLAAWNGSTWAGLGPTDNFGPSTMAIHPSGDLIIGGGFQTVDGVVYNGVARWNGLAWSPLGTGIAGQVLSPAVVSSLAISASGDLYAGGSFNSGGPAPLTNIAQWSGGEWRPLGQGTPMQVKSLCMTRTGDVLAAGGLTGGAGVPPSTLMRWTTRPACPADFNCTQTLEVQDIFDFLAAWFASSSAADLNGDGLSVQDIFDFLAIWFAGC